LKDGWEQDSEEAGGRETFESRYEKNEQLNSCTLIFLA